MNIDSIILAIEAEQYDFEPTLRIPGLREVRNDELILRLSEGSSSIFANKVVRSAFTSNPDDKIRQVIDFYESKQKSFAWWVGPKSQPDDLSIRLKSKGFTLEDVYSGLAIPVQKASSFKPAQWTWTIREALTEPDLRNYVSINAKIWGMDLDSMEAAIRERKSYISLPGRRGGYIVAYNNGGLPIGNATFRISSDGQTMYLIGAAVLPEYRNKGVYHSLLQYRLNKSKEEGCQLLTVQARARTSEPILRRLGFKEYCKFEMFVKTF
ncbi:hypothetical protein J14TS2_07970 [Bacillus sp. J14TS2]|uniref:GNAT family N-acetyltransferase n=1 Tax=Bacillus sp. J14TS2 TaxID=2807188 RepID=UPI001B24C919|nr:GNAT family N-acetyltransferase [Bacillus sp. J14TS2]GIN70322.1 hypothetical protein J14TS2_07970 [Bacillus sp. J14TS2]